MPITQSENSGLLDLKIPFFQLQNIKIPCIFYGTAWKEDRTDSLTQQAIRAGFRAIDTANQRKHYFEEGVGQALSFFQKPKVNKIDNPQETKMRETVSRSELFLQTKFTFSSGQDHRKPYLEGDPIASQVLSSFESSLSHLQTDFLDSYVLHGPYRSREIVDQDFEAWTAMERLVDQKKIKFLGVSNVNITQLKKLTTSVRIKPSFVQNRCYASSRWDLEIRNFCREQNILYQGFSILTANSQDLAGSLLTGLANKYNCKVPQIVFRFCHQMGMISLNGSSSWTHLIDDLGSYKFELNAQELSQIENVTNTLSNR